MHIKLDSIFRIQLILLTAFVDAYHHVIPLSIRTQDERTSDSDALFTRPLSTIAGARKA